MRGIGGCGSRRRACSDSRSGKRAHLANASQLEDSRALFQRRPCGTDIIDEHDDASGKRAASPRRRECVLHIATPAGSGQAGLRGRDPDALQGVHNGKAQVFREVGGLIEASLPPLRRVQRYRNNTGGTRDDIVTATAHQFGQRPRQRAASFVLQGMDDGAKRTIVRADRPRAIHERPPAAAPRTRAERDTDRAPAGKRIAAAVAQGRGERANRGPAALTDCTP